MPKEVGAPEPHAPWRGPALVLLSAPASRVHLLSQRPRGLPASLLGAVLPGRVAIWLPVSWTKRLSALMDAQLPALTCSMPPRGALISLSAYINERITETSRTGHRNVYSEVLFIRQISILSCDAGAIRALHSALRAKRFRKTGPGGSPCHDSPMLFIRA